MPFPFLGDLPYSGTEPGSPALQADALTSEPLGKPKYLTGMLYLQSYVEADMANGSQSSLLLNLEAVSILFRMWLAIRSTRTDQQNETYLPILIKTEVLFSYNISVVKFTCETKK